MASSKSSRNEFEAGPWKVVITRSHILKSKCERGKPDGCQKDGRDICDVCKSVCLYTPLLTTITETCIFLMSHGFLSQLGGEGVGDLVHSEVGKYKYKIFDERWRRQF
jgi:hypothetical protein